LERPGFVEAGHGVGVGETLSVYLAVCWRGWGGGMPEEDRIGLADFLTDLRAELSEAQSRAAGDSLKLGVEEISLTLEVAYTLTKAGEASAGVKAKFWVFASAEAGVKGSLSSERANTQQLTLTLKPRVEQVVIDQRGQKTTDTRGVDVEGRLAAGEEKPTLPPPRRS
jgi:NTP-dependent ternary system trypsin peptidase co-occuring protein